MSITALDGNRFAEMIQYGANQLSANVKMVDALNVFPVPDGDTGTNMNLSLASGAKEAEKNKQKHIGHVAAAFSKGLLMGARGNSGVILSQLFRGFAKEIETKQLLTSLDFARALESGVQTAYKAVMKPVEGTILTVAKDAANKAVEAAANHSDIIVVMERTLQEAKQSLARTPDLLPVLKEVGVVDSGGQGLVFIYEGFLAVLKGEKLPEVSPAAPSMEELVNAQHHQSVQGYMSTGDIQFGYCTEFMVRFEGEKKPFNEDDFRNDLSNYGDSLLVISDEEVVKVHIHTEQPGEVLTFGQQYGPLIQMKIENMREQHSALLAEGSSPANTAVTEKPEEQKEYALISVSMGRGIAELLKSIGVTYIIEGGQTMNPSTEDFVKAIKSVHAKNIIILPNNKNIILAAEQAAEIAEENVIVVPSVTVPQGIAAALSFNPSASISANERQMNEAKEEVKTGQITYAVRDTVYNGMTIAKADYMGIFDGEIVSANKHAVQAAKDLLDQMIDEESEIVMILSGEDADESEVNEVIQYIEEQYEDIETEVHKGGQPLYSFIFSVE